MKRLIKNRVDLPVAPDDAITSSDTPKGFSRLLRFKEMALKRQQEKKDIKSGAIPDPAAGVVSNLFFLKMKGTK